MENPSKKRQRLPALPEQAEQLVAHFLPIHTCHSAEALKVWLWVFPLRYPRVKLFMRKGTYESSAYAKVIAAAIQKPREITLQVGQLSKELFDACLSVPCLKSLTLQCSPEAIIPTLEYLVNREPSALENLVLSLGHSYMSYGAKSRLVQLLLDLYTSKFREKLLALVVGGFDLFLPSSEQSINAEQLLTAPRLKTVDFRDLSLSMDFIKALARSLKGNSHIVDLHFCRCLLGDLGVIELSIALEFNTTIEGLVLETVGMADIGAKALALRLNRNTTIKYLYLKEEEVGNEGSAAFANMLRVNKSLLGLKLQCANFDSDGAAEFGPVLRQNKTLKVLVLSFRHVPLETRCYLEEVAREAGVLERYTYCDFYSALHGQFSMYKHFESIIGKRLPCLLSGRLGYLFQAHVSSYSLDFAVPED